MSAAFLVVLLFLPATASCDKEDVSLDYGSLLQHHHQPRTLHGTYASELKHVFVLSQEGEVIVDGNTTACKAHWPLLADGYAVAQVHYDPVNIHGSARYFLMSREVELHPLGIAGSYWFMGGAQDVAALGDRGIRRMAFGFPDSKDLTRWVTWTLCDADFFGSCKQQCLFTNADELPTLEPLIAAEQAKAGQ
ncbi:unnamed protein product [Symbiodinium sp. CCMP2456]|nr:unnamed protein product [Symbiodinium sp. CCMP2456]